MSQLAQAFAAHDLKLIEITPVELDRRHWLCVGFEEAGEDRGDFMHLGFLYADQAEFVAAPDLHEAVAGYFSGRDRVLMRLHSECLLGDAIHSTMCDCGEQLSLALNEIARKGEGIILYLRQEGRGIGMRNKLSALSLQYGFRHGQQTGHRHSSDNANLALGHEIDERDYTVAGNFLNALGISSTSMITGNGAKVASIANAGVRIIETVDLWAQDLSDRAKHEMEEKRNRGYRYARYDNDDEEAPARPAAE
ncbi:MAG: GTP cyclohydrolase II RibA [Pseudomonadota bacterium]